jgi:hypothetical protein
MGVSNVIQLYEIIGKFSLTDTILNQVKNNSIHLLNRISGDTLDIGYPNKYTGLYRFSVFPGVFKLVYSSIGYLPQSIDTIVRPDNPSLILTLDVTLRRDTSVKRIIPVPVVYEKIVLAAIPTVTSIDSSILIKNMNVSDIGDTKIKDSDILYYTVQVIALHNPIDVSYFKHITNMKVLYNDSDKFYRYTTGKFATREEAYALRSELIAKGYPEEIFIKKVSKE